MNNLDDSHDVLLAEDDLEDVEIFGWAMQQADISYELRHAENGDRLFVLLKEKIPYILFLDIKMPCKDGISCITEIRRNREYDHMPVIMYTAYAHPESMENSYRGGANYFLSKSAAMTDMVNAIKKIFAIDWKSYQHYPIRDQFRIN